MHSQLELTPHGTVICRDDARKELAVFHDSEAAGLIRIAGQKAVARSRCLCAVLEGIH